ncbi:MAG: ABC transporter ATP-binding protein [Acidimicrobiales bacterium]
MNQQLAAGETLGIVGPNGSGKSSLLRCVVGEQRPSAGTVRIKGRPAGDLSRRELARTMAVVLQHQTVDPGISVAQVIELGRLPHRSLLQRSGGAERAFLIRCAERTGVAGLLAAPFERLSGGEQQRVVLARALAQEPEILLLDEPTNHLDLRYQLELVALLSDLALPVLVVLHDLTLAARLCDRLVVLDAGQVHTQGPPTEVPSPDLLARVWQVESQTIHDAHGTPSSYRSHRSPRPIAVTPRPCHRRAQPPVTAEPSRPGPGALVGHCRSRIGPRLLACRCGGVGSTQGAIRVRVRTFARRRHRVGCRAVVRAGRRTHAGHRLPRSRGPVLRVAAVRRPGPTGRPDHVRGWFVR